MTSSLTSLIAAPAVWAGHFLLSYATAAIWCAKFARRDESLGGARIAIAAYTIAALGIVFAIGWRAWRQSGMPSPPADDRATAGARTSFLAFATLLVASLAAVAIIYAALAIAFVGSCR